MLEVVTASITKPVGVDDRDMEDRPYLTPAELDFRRDESVTALGDGRYVVATAGAASSASSTAARGDRRDTRADRAPATDRGARGNRGRTLDTDGGVAAADDTDSRGAASPDRTDRIDRPDYFVDLSVRTDAGTFDTRVEGDDIGEVFASMLRWYARRVSPDDDPERVLSILRSRSEPDL